MPAFFIEKKKQKNEDVSACINLDPFFPSMAALLPMGVLWEGKQPNLFQKKRRRIADQVLHSEQQRDRNGVMGDNIGDGIFLRVEANF